MEKTQNKSIESAINTQSIKIKIQPKSIFFKLHVNRIANSSKIRIIFAIRSSLITVCFSTGKEGKKKKKNPVATRSSCLSVCLSRQINIVDTVLLLSVIGEESYHKNGETKFIGRSIVAQVGAEVSNPENRHKIRYDLSSPFWHAARSR